MLVNLNEAVKAYAKQMGVTESEAKQDAMAIINDYMAQGYPRDFAEATFIEDTEDAAQQVEELTAKAKASGAEKVKAKKKPANYSMDGAAKKRAPRKPNEEKRMVPDGHRLTHIAPVIARGSGRSAARGPCCSFSTPRGNAHLAEREYARFHH